MGFSHGFSHEKGYDTRNIMMIFGYSPIYGTPRCGETCYSDLLGYSGSLKIN
jgi:hypothetical protein